MMSPLGAVPADTTNKFADDAGAAKFGQRLFFEKGNSGPLVVGTDTDPNALGKVGDTGKVHCATCHDPKSWFNDNKPLSLGIKYTGRNDPSVINVAFYEYDGWGGRADHLWTQAIASLEGAQAANRLAIAHLVYAKYKPDYEALFGMMDPDLNPASPNAARFPPAGKPKANAMAPDGPWEMMAAADQKIINTILANVAKTIEAYQRLLVSRNAPFDQYVAGNYAAISAAAKRGLGLFIGKAACDACHSGSFFTDQDFHVTGVPQTGDHVPMMDLGHYTDLGGLIANPFNGAGAFSDDPAEGMKDFMELGMPADKDKSAFRTKNLRQIAMTGPYMHTGQLATLTDVINFYNMGGGTVGVPKDPKMVPLNLTMSETSDLVEFLNSLTGDPVTGALTMDTSAP
jgi:cytochrome c peroxidase